MNPAYSVIFFTTASGFGYGLAFWLLVLGSSNFPQYRWLNGVGLALALAAITSGLLASTMHLGQPSRAWRAFTQWRSSWLSREGIAAVVSVAMISLAWLGAIAGMTGTLLNLVAWLGILTAVVTVLCTGMIYQSLKPIAAWRSSLTTPIYLTYACLTGAFGTASLMSSFNGEGSLAAIIAVISAIILIAMKIAYWRRALRVISLTPESATGLGKIGKVQQLEGPHTTGNFVSKEMGFRIARKHADKLRKIVLLGGLSAPALLGFLGVFESSLATIFWTIATVLSIGGAIVERWLFFAEAKHAVSAFYGD
ncbi:MAG: DmsC/YnfH family molybdoenzyme membrane anchor subunit [Rhodospirillales bacterium]|jgi:DMSO reductase anchor subunit